MLTFLFNIKKFEKNRMLIYYSKMVFLIFAENYMGKSCKLCESLKFGSIQ